MLSAPGTAPRELVGLSEGERARVRRESLGFVFQEHLLLPELTAVENAALPLLLKGMRRPDAERHAAVWLAARGSRASRAGASGSCRVVRRSVSRSRAPR